MENHNALSAERAGGSLQRMVRPRLSNEQIAERRRWKWRCNVERLKVCVLNMLTLGLGEGLWYGDIPYQNLNVSLLARLGRFVRVNLHNLKIAAATRWRSGEQIPDAGNERERRWYCRVRLTNRYELDVVVFHKRAKWPNGKVSDGGK